MGGMEKPKATAPPRHRRYPRGSPQPAATHLYWEFHERGFQQAVRMGRWKAVRLKNGAALDGQKAAEFLAAQTINPDGALHV